MKKSILSLLGISIGFMGFAQKSIDLSMEHPKGSGILRNYSIYEPAAFNTNDSNKLLIGFHPYNPGTWNANTWRDTLKSFVELVDVLLVCPDGGNNGRIDDADDYSFTEALIDTIQKIYKIDPKKIFAMGFSVGGKAVYEYGLSHPKQIKGMIPIGAAIEGVDFTSLLNKARCRSFYLVHGEKDSPATRYYPMKANLEFNKGLVDAILMANIGHTINFPNRNTILKRAFNFIDTSGCNFLGINELDFTEVTLYPSITAKGQTVQLSGAEKIDEILIYSSQGQQVMSQRISSNFKRINIETSSLPKGMLFVRVLIDGNDKVFRLIIN